MFLPTTPEEMRQLGWDRPDVILISGDSYIDSPFMGIALLGRLLQSQGCKVGVICQPDVNSPDDITRLGEPALFWGVSGGCIDSMVANYTASQKKRRSDDYTPGGLNNRRPDRAVIVYANLIRRYFKNTCPIVLGGVEASLRRLTHYDYWNDRLRAPILFDAKADYLLYGMAEYSILRLTEALRKQEDPRSIRGLCYLSNSVPDGYRLLPSFEACQADPDVFIQMFHTFYRNNDPGTAQGLAQPKSGRYCIQNPPAPHLTTAELDSVCALPFTHAQHPFYEQQGPVKALETIRFATPTHRGCYGECNFCAIAVHEGRTVISRSQKSILESIRQLTKHPDFKGYIHDLSGPTANMYGFECAKKLRSGVCEDRRCLWPAPCPSLKPTHAPAVRLMQESRKIAGIKKVFVASGIRYDLLSEDQAHAQEYIDELAAHHVSGQLKVAPEHTDAGILKRMGKPGPAALLEFKRRFDQASRQAGKKQFLTYYFIAAYPGCSEKEMTSLKDFCSRELKITPEQIQIFTPLPSTWAGVIYYTEKDPFTGEKVFVEKNPGRKTRQKEIALKK